MASNLFDNSETRETAVSANRHIAAARGRVSARRRMQVRPERVDDRREDLTDRQAEKNTYPLEGGTADGTYASL